MAAVVFVDYLTKWPEAFVVPNQYAATVGKSLVEEVVSRHGVPWSNQRCPVLPCTIPCHPRMSELQIYRMLHLLWHPRSIHGWQYMYTHCLPPVRVSVDDTVTLTYLVHPRMAIYMYTHTAYLQSQYPWMTQLPCHLWSMHGQPHTHCLPPVRVSVDDTVTLISLVHPRMVTHTLPTPCQSICG